MRRALRKAGPDFTAMRVDTAVDFVAALEAFQPDVVEAMMSRHRYRPALEIEAGLTKIQKGKGTLFDPAGVDAGTALFRQNRFSFG